MLIDYTAKQVEQLLTTGKLWLRLAPWVPTYPPTITTTAAATATATAAAAAPRSSSAP